ncbi:MAG: hypothetical protein M3354_05600 [Chloroflexota bacterium]|nr:hypothetical protein [Chloroflexota bacterium]
MFGGAAGALAQEATPVATDETTQGGDIDQIAGASGLVAAVVQVADTIDIDDTNIEVVTVAIEDSFNDNDLDVNVIRDVLNESPILNDNNVVIADVIDVSDVDVDPIIAIGILQGGDIIIFTSGDQ